MNTLLNSSSRLDKPVYPKQIERFSAPSGNQVVKKAYKRQSRRPQVFVRETVLLVRNEAQVTKLRVTKLKACVREPEPWCRAVDLNIDRIADRRESSRRVEW